MGRGDHRPDRFGPPRGGGRGPGFGPGGPRDGRGWPRPDDRRMSRDDYRPDRFGPPRGPGFGPGGPRVGGGWQGSGARPWSDHSPFPFGPPNLMRPPRSPEQVF